MAPTFPAIDTGALDKAIKTLGTQQTDLDTQNSILCSVLIIVQDSKVPWASEAAKQWTAVLNAYLDDLDTASTAFGNMATSIGTLSKALKAAKSDYDTAKSKAGFIRPDGQWQQNLPNPQTDKQTNAALGDMQNAVDAANRAMGAATDAFVGITDATDKLNATGWNGAQPQMPNGADPSKYSSLHLLAIIFGSVVGNRQQGVPYEENQLKALGMDKNKIKFKVKGWPRGTFPDGIGDDDTMWEIKSNTTEVDYRYQIRLQMEYARRSGRSYRILMRKGTKVSARLLNAINNNPNADIIYDNGDGTYESEKTGEILRPTGKGGAMTKVAQGKAGEDDNEVVGPPDKPGPVGGDPEMGDPTDTGGGDEVPGGGSDEDPEPVEPVEPVEPIEPIEPIIP